MKLIEYKSSKIFYKFHYLNKLIPFSLTLNFKTKSMNTLIRIIITAILVLVIDYFMSGITVASFTTSVLVAVVLALLNTFIKPLLIFFTFPVTILTLGLFLLVINAIIIILCSEIVGGFHVDSFWTALLFSIILSLSQSLMNGLTKEKK